MWHLTAGSQGIISSASCGAGSAQASRVSPEAKNYEVTDQAMNSCGVYFSLSVCSLLFGQAAKQRLPSQTVQGEGMEGELREKRQTH